MTNPFAKGSAATTGTPTIADPVETPSKPKGSAPAADPFADPSGISGEFIVDFVGNLLLVKPTEYIPEMKTKKSNGPVVRADLAVLDDENDPGRIVTGVLLFQQALRREAKAVLDGPSPYLLGRLLKTETGGGNDLYIFEEGTDEDKDLARQFLTVATL